MFIVAQILSACFKFKYKPLEIKDHPVHNQKSSLRERRKAADRRSGSSRNSEQNMDNDTDQMICIR